MVIEASRAKRVYTYQDYLDSPDDGKRYEILDGELVVNAAPSTAHQTVVFNLGLFLGNQVRQHRLGRMFIAPTEVKLADTALAQPDLQFVTRDRLDIIQPQGLVGPPDLVVEVRSPTTARHDLVTKRRMYARYSVPNYWLFEPLRGETEALVLEGAEYSLGFRARGDEAFSAPPFPDLVIPLSEVWE